MSAEEINKTQDKTLKHRKVLDIRIHVGKNKIKNIYKGAKFNSRPMDSDMRKALKSETI